MIRTRLFALMSTAAVLTVAGCAPSDSGSSGSGDEPEGGATTEEAAADESGGDPVQVGIIYSETGPLAAYGKQYKEGLEAGLDYATDGT